MKFDDIFLTEARRGMSVKAAAEKVAKDLVVRYGHWSDTTPLVEPTDNGYRVAWEEGPPSWAMNDPYDAFEELMGGDFDESEWQPFYDEIPGIWMEPNMSFELHVGKE